MNIKNAMDSLREISLKLKGDFVENNYGGFLSFKNEMGSGNGKAIKIFPGLEVLALSIYAKKELVIDNFYNSENGLHYVFCIEGYLHHCFDSEDEKHKINRLQNVILGNSKKENSRFIIEKETLVKFSIISILNISKISDNLDNQSQLSFLLSKVLKKFNKTKKYSYFGEISTAAFPHVETLMEINGTNLTNRLIVEAAVFKILSLQHSDHIKNTSDYEDKNPLSKTDSIKIIQLSDYISQNLQENVSLKKLTQMSGLNEKKIQKGFQYFFDETVNKFVTNLRILKAKELLENSDQNISQIVYFIGLNSRSYFSKIFYKKYGLIPTDYRKYHHISNPTFELTYTSKATQGINRSDLLDILKISKKNNAKLNITGCLIYHRNQFLQILEGPKNDVELLVEKIRRDARNKKLTVIYSGVKSGRNFKEWDMALVQDEFDFVSDSDGKFGKLKIDFLDMINVNSEIKAKYIWEKARNYLIVNQSVKV